MVKVDGAELRVRDEGSGTPVLLIHGALISRFLDPLADELAATGKFRAITYARRGFEGKGTGPASVETQAKDALAVMTELGVDKAHIVGHSFGTAVALQMAVQAPDRVASLSLLDPVMLKHIPSGEETFKQFQQLFELYQAGDNQKTLTAAITGLHGPGFEKILQPGWFEQGVADLDTFFKVENPSLGEWDFGQEQAGTIQVPVHLVVGEKSLPSFKESVDVLSEWMSNTKKDEIAGGTHLYPASHAKETAQAIAGFLNGK